MRDFLPPVTERGKRSVSCLNLSKLRIMTSRDEFTGSAIKLLKDEKKLNEDI